MIAVQLVEDEDEIRYLNCGIRLKDGKFNIAEYSLYHQLSGGCPRQVYEDRRKCVGLGSHAEGPG